MVAITAHTVFIGCANLVVDNGAGTELSVICTTRNLQASFKTIAEWIA